MGFIQRKYREIRIKYIHKTHMTIYIYSYFCILYKCRYVLFVCNRKPFTQGYEIRFFQFSFWNFLLLLFNGKHNNRQIVFLGKFAFVCNLFVCFCILYRFLIFICVHIQSKNIIHTLTLLCLYVWCIHMVCVFYTFIFIQKNKLNYISFCEKFSLLQCCVSFC